MATSNHAVGFYPRAQTIDHRVVPRPDSRYGVSKAFSEALASLYADKHGIGFLCTRIGNFGTKPIDSRRLAIWISPRDYTQLVRIGLEHPDIRFEIVYGVSGNKRSWYDNSNAYRLGYKPQDDSEPYAAEILAREANQPKDPVAERYQGGTFCAAEYDAEQHAGLNGAAPLTHNPRFPAKAGTHGSAARRCGEVDPGFRRGCGCRITSGS